MEKRVIQSSLGVAHTMIGSSCLLGALYTQRVGYFSIVWICLFLATCNHYSAQLLVKHKGNCSNNNQIIHVHFQNSQLLNITHDSAAIVYFGGVCISYFQMGILQGQGLFQNNQSILYIYFFSTLLLTWILLIIDHIQMCVILGFISPLAFICFTTWSFITAPIGQKTIRPIESWDIFPYCGIIFFAFACHGLLIPFLQKQSAPQQHQIATKIGFTVATFTNLYFYLSGFTIINRQSRVPEPRSVQDFYQYNNWQVQFIQIVYLAHLFTTTPLFINVTIQNFKSLVGIQASRHSVKIDLGLALSIIILGFFFTIFNVSIQTVAALSGAIGGFVLVFFIPLVIHLKCQYFSQREQFYQQYQDEQDHDDLKDKNQIKKKLCCFYVKSQPNKTNKILQLSLSLFLIVCGLLIVEENIRRLF